MSTVQDVKVPDIGDFKDVEIIEVHVKAGDAVSADSPLITLGIRQGVDGGSIAVGRRGEGGQGQGRRQGLARLADPEHGDGRRGTRGGRDGGTTAVEGEDPAGRGAGSRSRPGCGAYGGRSGLYETIDVRVPDIGNFKDVPIIEVMVKEGDWITSNAPLITLESDKASMEVPSPRRRRGEGHGRRGGRQSLRAR